MKIIDIRGNSIKKEANSHTKILENIIEKHQRYKTLTKVKRIVRNVYDLIETAGAGYLAGYVVSGGDVDTATQFAEYATVLWPCFKIGIEWPLTKLARKNSRNIEEKIEEEKREALSLELHRYEPEKGLDFTNHPSNYDNLIENNIQSSYWGNLESARKPIRRILQNVAYCALVTGVFSLIADTEVNIIDLVGPNLIEKGLKLTHSIFGQIEPLKDYLSQATHKHIGDFNQLQMLYTGAAIGAIQTAREFLIGNYQRIKAKLKAV